MLMDPTFAASVSPAMGVEIEFAPAVEVYRVLLLAADLAFLTAIVPY